MNQITEADVVAFCDNMKASLLACLQKNRQVYINVKYDTDPVFGYCPDESSGEILMGCTYTIATDIAAKKLWASKTKMDSITESS